MAILENEILITVHNKTIKYYESLGYIIPMYLDTRGVMRIKQGTQLLVKPDDLPKTSSEKLTKICDRCKTKLKTNYFAILKQRKNNNGEDICKTCSIRMRAIEKAKNNSLKLKCPNVANEFVRFINEDYKDYTTYMINFTSNQLVLWKCSNEICKYEWEAKISDRTKKSSGCPSCWGRIVSDKNRLSLFFPELIEEWNYSKNGNLTPNDFTYSSHKRVWWICEYDHEWETPVYSRTITKANCPICSESKGEKRIREWLEFNNINFTPQQIYPNLNGLGGKPLSYDFYLTELNILIEYQGEFHDGSGNNNYTKLNLETQQEHDRRKRNYSEQHNIELLEIWYWDFENIEKILINKLM